LFFLFREKASRLRFNVDRPAILSCSRAYRWNPRSRPLPQNGPGFENLDTRIGTKMKRLAALCATLAVACSVTACNPTPAPSPNTHDADVKAIQDNETQWNADWASKDAAKIASHYEDDAILMVPGGPPTTGKDAIQKSLTTTVSSMDLKFQASKVDVASSGDLGYTQGSYTLALTNPKTKKVANDHGSYVTTYRKQADGSWKAVADIATSEVPPAAPPAKKH
jgi:uncharacterized protein (TIGR02246 family)